MQKVVAKIAAKSQFSSFVLEERDNNTMSGFIMSIENLITNLAGRLFSLQPFCAE